jgi:uncharacterized protein YdaU (DUF1376 family)
MGRGGALNFYKHHLGDYSAATAHLSWDEDCAYRRLLDQYYKREAPIPADVKEACRLARAQTPSQRRAVDTVLREFFVLQDDGWHQKRCDEEIGAANAQAETNRRIAEEREARKRERTQHESLNGASNGSSTNRSPATIGEREPSQTPDSRHQTPDSIPSGDKPLRERARGARLTPDWSPGPDGIAFAEAEGLRNGRAMAELAKFRDYWTAQPGQKGVKTDWPATWRNWCRKAAETPAKAGSNDIFAGAV